MEKRAEDGQLDLLAAVKQERPVGANGILSGSQILYQRFSETYRKGEKIKQNNERLLYNWWGGLYKWAIVFYNWSNFKDYLDLVLSYF